MSVVFRSSIALLGFVACVAASPCFAQQATPSAAPRFAEGVLTTIQPNVEPAEAISIHNLVEVRSDEALQWKPASTAVSRTLYEMAQEVPFVQQVWCLELSFKPLRMIEVDLPQRDGGVRRQRVWYMVYRVRNTGAGLVPELQENGDFTTKLEGTSPVRFIPQFVLSVQDRDAVGKRVRKAYLDRILPAALEPISRREFSGGKLLTSAEMAQQELVTESGRSARGVWGVAMWENVDPSTDFFSVYVQGLSNAYRWDDPQGALKVGDTPGTGRQFTRKTLQLNFWRPGDEYQENEREIRFGVPIGKANLYDGAGEGVAYRWVFR